MSNRVLNIVAVILIVLMGIAAFSAGYLVRGVVAPPAPAYSAAEEGLTRNDLTLFWEAWSHIERNFIDPLPNKERIVYGAIRGALAELEDPYTVFINPPERQQEIETLRGNFGGIGASLSRDEAGQVLLEPIPGNPAEAAGIGSGDVLLAVDGESISETMSLSEIAELIRGEKGTEVVLTVRQGANGSPVEITVVRDDILIPSVSSRLIGPQEDIGYIRLTRFSGESAGEVEQALNTLLEAGATRLILDLRGNGGGLLDAGVAVADHFLGEGPIMYQQTRDRAETTINATPETAAGDLPLLVLVDGGTASAAEIVAGALRDRDRAQLVGSGPTFGKGSVQLVFDLSDGSSVHVTSSRWYTPGRQPLDEGGLQPDLAVIVSAEDVENGRDAVLQRAIDYYETGSEVRNE